MTKIRDEERWRMPSESYSLEKLHPVSNTLKENFKKKLNQLFDMTINYVCITCILFSRLCIACQARQSNLDSFFEHENQACTQSISDMGQLRQGSNSDLMEC